MKARNLVALSAMALPTIAMAHPGHNLSPGFMAGALHPWSGVDHVLAMLAIGLWAAQQGGRMRWAVPLSFVLLMLAGDAMGVAGLQFGAVEQGIAASVCVLGLLLATATRLPLMASVTVAGGFALFHGYAHGIEAPLQTNAWSYMSGFALSTLALLGLGFALATILLKRHQTTALRWTGAAIAASGFALLLA